LGAPDTSLVLGNLTTLFFVLLPFAAYLLLSSAVCLLLLFAAYLLLSSAVCLLLLFAANLKWLLPFAANLKIMIAAFFLLDLI
jgi:hypothetical protein